MVDWMYTHLVVVLLGTVGGSQSQETGGEDGEGETQGAEDPHGGCQAPRCSKALGREDGETESVTLGGDLL